MWFQNVTLTMGLAGTVSIPTLAEAYDVFFNDAENSALKVIITHARSAQVPTLPAAPPRR
jgi:hypothetical protein